MPAQLAHAHPPYAEQGYYAAAPLWQRGAARDLEPAMFRCWIRPLEIVMVEDGLAVLSAPSRLHAEWSQSYFGSVILRSLQKQLPDVSRIEVTVVPILAEKESVLEAATW